MKDRKISYWETDEFFLKKLDYVKLKVKDIKEKMSNWNKNDQWWLGKLSHEYINKICNWK